MHSLTKLLITDFQYWLTNQTKPKQPKLQNQTYQKCMKANLQNTNYQTKHTKRNQTKPNLQNQNYQNKPTEQKVSNQTYRTKTPKQNLSK